MFCRQEGTGKAQEWTGKAQEGTHSPLYPSGLLVEQAQKSILVLMRVMTSGAHSVLLGDEKRPREGSWISSAKTTIWEILLPTGRTHLCLGGRLHEDKPTGSAAPAWHHSVPWQKSREGKVTGPLGKGNAAPTRFVRPRHYSTSSMVLVEQQWRMNLSDLINKTLFRRATVVFSLILSGCGFGEH